MSVQIEKKFSLCGLNVKSATMMCTTAQIVLCVTMGTLMRCLLDPSIINSILFFIHIVCAVMATVFLSFCGFKRKFGSIYEVILHAHLLTLLLMALTSFFCVLYLPLSFLQQPHSVGEGMHYLFLLVSSGGMLAFQVLQKGVVEQMLQYMEHYYR